MSLVTLQSTPRPQVQRSSANAEAKEASFLTFDYVNKHARVRVSPTPLDLSSFEGKGDFLAVANSKGWFAVIVRSSDGQIQLCCSPLSHLHSAFATNPGAGVDEIQFTPQRILTISPATPNVLTIACNDTRLLLGSTQGPIAVYDCSQLFTAGTNHIAPMHTFSGSRPCEQIAPNPGDIPELVAVLRQGDGSSNFNSVELLNLQTLQVAGGWISGGTHDTAPSSMSWSPRGKQIAVGLQSGDIITFSPGSTDSPKSVIPKPSLADDCRVLAITWLANPTFHAVYAPLGPLTSKMPQYHYIINFDQKANSVSEVSLSAPYPFPGLRPPGTFVLALRNWNPVKFLLFVGDGTSSEIGSIGCFAESNRESWYNLSLDEAFTPSLPLDKNLDETALLGLEVDITSTNAYDHISVSGEKVEVPPPPIVYAYCSDGTILAWHVVNASGSLYSGMANPPPASSSMSDSLMSMTPSTSGTAETPTKSASIIDAAQGATSAFDAFGQAAKQPTFGQSGFGFNQSLQSTPSKFGSPQSTSSGFGAFSQTGKQSTFGQSSFGQSPSGQSSFGQTAFGQPTQSLSFGQPLSFGQSSFGSSSLGQPASFGSGGGGFASYASSTPAAFGQNSSAFTPGSSINQSQSNAEVPELTREISMGIEASESDLGGLSLGPASTTESEKPGGKGAIGLFGQASLQPTSVPSGSASAAVGSGFGAFSSWSQRKDDSSVPVSIVPPETKQSPSPAFGHSGFAQVSAFGKTGFGSTTAATSGSFSGATSGGFGAYANSFASFAGSSPSGPPAKPAWVTDKSEPTPSSGPQRPGFTSQEPSSISTAEKVPISLAQVASPTTNAPDSSSTPSGTPRKESVFSGSSAFETGKTAESQLPFKTSSTPTTEGAFSNLKQSPIGLSAFGQPDQNSPFFKADKPGSSSAISTPTFEPAPSVGSVFGSPSRLGTSSSEMPTVFNSSSTPTPASRTLQTTPSAASGGFLTFSGSSSPFGKQDGLTSKSFSELLKGSKDEDEPKTQPTSVFSLPTSQKQGGLETPKKREPENESVNLFTVSTTPPPKSSQTAQQSARNDDDVNPESSEDEVGSKASSEELEEGQIGDNDNFTSDTGSESDVDEFLAYEDISARLEEQDVEEPHELSPVAEETSLHDDSFDEGVTSVQETVIKAESPDPLKIPLPLSRSPSVVPTDLNLSPALEVKSKPSSALPLDSADISLPSSPSTPIPNNAPLPKSAKLPSPSLIIDHSDGHAPVKYLESSTTPPSSPAKLSPLLPSPTPTPAFGVGSARTSMRPARSSPLARASIVGETGGNNGVTSPSPPPPLKPRPASPKPTFGQWGTSPTSAPESSEDKKLPRSRTPPLSALSLPKPSPSSALNTPLLATNAQSIPSLSSGGSTPTKNFFASPSGSSLQLEAKTLPGSSPFDRLPSQKTTALPTTSPLPPPFPTGSLLGNKVPQTPPTAPPAKSPMLPIPEPSVQEGMQAECMYLFTSMNKELEELKSAELVILKHKHLMKANPTSLTESDLGDPNKWLMGDIIEHGKAMRQVQADFAAAKATREQFLKSVQEIESDMLKATTRNEEIVRFNKAISNVEFTKMLKLRTLGPEYLETQTKLRRKMRTIRDRVEKLEGHLHASKKMLSRQKSGKVGFKPPSLDTVNRTYRNIGIAITQQNEDITQLTARIAKLDPKSFGKLPTRDKRLPDKTRRKLNVTPSVAATTAAALNAERSAYKLKQVLLSVRDKPLLNDKAAQTTPSRVDFKTPQKASNSTGWESSWQISSSSPTTATQASSPTVLPTPPQPPPPPGRDAESLSPLSTGGTRRGAGSKYHQKSAPLKRPVSTPADSQQASPMPATASAPALKGFDWGPLPTHALNTKPVSSLPFSLQ